MEEHTTWEEEISLFDLVNILLKRKWIVLGITLLGILFGLLAWRFIPQTFKAEIPVSFSESSFPREFRGEVQVTYYGKDEPVTIPYVFSPRLDRNSIPENILSSFADQAKLRAIAEEKGFGKLFDRARGTFSVSMSPQEKGGFLLTISAQNANLVGRIAESLVPELEEALRAALESQHRARVQFLQDLLKTSEERYQEARARFFTFLDRQDPFEIEERVQRLEERLKVLQNRRDTLFKLQDAPLFSLPLAPEVLKEVSFFTLEKALTLQEELRKRYTEEIQKLDSEINALEVERKALKIARQKNAEAIREYNLLLRDFTFWKEVHTALTLSFPPSWEDFPFDGTVTVGPIRYSGSKKDLKLNLAAGLVAGLFLGVLGAFFAEFWERAKTTQ